jgi:hypothetical protein
MYSTTSLCLYYGLVSMLQVLYLPNLINWERDASVFSLPTTELASQPGMS